MKLAASTGDYGLYTTSQEFALEHIRDAFEKYLFALGKCVLQQYSCFED